MKNEKINEKKIKGHSGAHQGKPLGENRDKNKQKLKNKAGSFGDGKHGKDQQKPAKRKQHRNPPMRITPLGGCMEIGKNITVVEYENDMILIDCGFAFPEHEMFGIDVVIPDFTYIKENASKLRGLIITHGHEDHIGGIPFLLKEVSVPIYASPLSMGLIDNKLSEHGLTAEKHIIKSGDVFKLGAFRVEAITTNHSIADAFAFSVKCPGGHLVHTGDFKVDYSPLDGKRIDLSRFAALGDEGVDVLMCDSTNVLKPGYTPSEKVVIDSMNEIFDKTDKRIIIATFASNIYRIKHFMEASIEHGRKIAVSGRSMENVVKLAIELGYIDIPMSAFVDIRQIGNIPDSNLTIVTTGSQGEPMSALTRMANDSHKAVKLKKNDVVVFSSSPIPGNEKTITNIVNKLYEKKVDVFLSDVVDIHVSGHARQEELKLIHTLLRPRFFIPAHGEYRHLIEHGLLAEGLGMNKGNVFVIGNGDSLLVDNRQAKFEPKYAPAEGVLVDGYGIGDVGSVVLRDRKQLSEAGLVVISVALDSSTKKPVARPELMTRGFIYVKENAPLIDEATSVIYDTLDRIEREGIKDHNGIKNALRDDMRSFIYKKTRRNPVILSVILYV